MSQESARFHYAPQSAMLFALFMDGFEVGRLNESISELIQHGIGGRNTLTYAPEITLLSRLLYYSCSLVSFGRTPGQAFCDFVLTGSVPAENKEGQSRELVRKLERADMAKIAALYSVLPYLLQKKDVIYQNIVALYDILVKSEDLSSPANPATSTPTTTNTTPPTATSNTPSTTTTPSTTPDPSTTTTTTSAPPLDTYFSKFLRSLRSSVASISASSNERMEVVYKFAADVHRMLFLHYGSYLELPLRIMQVRMITQSPNRNQASLKALSWLVGFRISLLAYYAARVVLSEVDKEMYTTNTSTSTVDTNSNGSVGDSCVTGSVSEGGVTSSAVGKRCSLCIDALVSPAVVPCGHIFCWNCIVPYATNASASIDSEGSGGVKCPICRTEFQAQKIRALHNYV